jgi:uncharacterized protein YndB with AHSA1/START domain
MRWTCTIAIAAPISEVFAFFDDPVAAIRFQERAAQHFKGSEVIEVKPDGRRIIDLHMQAGNRAWTQTIVQEVREPPLRLVARSWTWTRHREDRLSTIETHRQLSPDGEGTRLEVAVTLSLEHPWRNPLAAVLNRLTANSAARLEMEHSLHAIAEHLEGRHRAASLT